jgi:hypothetical protein
VLSSKDIKEHRTAPVGEGGGQSKCKSLCSIPRSVELSPRVFWLERAS